MNKPFFALIGFALLAGCAEKPAPAPLPPPPAPTPSVVEIGANDFAFQAPDTIQGGWVTIRIRNNGQELHHGAVYRLDQGKTVEDMLKVSGPNVPEWLVAAGGPSGAAPGGGTLETTLKLAPGNYVLVCEIPSPDGKLHVMKGMIKPFTVVAPVADAAPAEADITVRLTDYDFEFSRELTAGRHVFRVENAPGQPHEIVIARLVPGKKAEDFLNWIEKERMAGPPPIEGIAGGTTALSTGELNVFEAELTPGDYAIICFIPDAKDFKAHAAHGMLKTIRITES
jgi:hypothetical protein